LKWASTASQASKGVRTALKVIALGSKLAPSDRIEPGDSARVQAVIAITITAARAKCLRIFCFLLMGVARCDGGGGHAGSR
jgi:hypothetical protein